MARLNSAGIHCYDCGCVSTYTGPTKVGSSKCGQCDHPLVRHQVDTQAGYALDSTGRMPDDFEIGAQFES
jgi:hypothetical protein